MTKDIIAAILPSFIIAFVGYYYSTKDSKLDLKSIANLIYYIFSPCMVYSSLAQYGFHGAEFMELSVSVVVLIFSLMLVTWFYVRLTGFPSKGIYLPIIFMNTGNVALPMSLFLYGQDGLSKAIMFHLVNVLFLYTMGVFIVSKKTNIKEFFKIPFVYAGAAGILVAQSPIRLPGNIAPYASMINSTIDILGKGAIPLLILSLGYSLKRTRIADLKHGITGAGIRVIVGPLIAFGLVAFFRYIGSSPTEAGYGHTVLKSARTTEAIIVLMGAMPAPIMSFLLNEKFDECPEVAASMVLMGTLAGIVTIPVVLTLIQGFIMS